MAFVTAGRPVQHTSVVPHDRHVRFPAVPVDDGVVDLVLVDFAQQRTGLVVLHVDDTLYVPEGREEAGRPLPSWIRTNGR